MNVHLRPICVYDKGLRVNLYDLWESKESLKINTAWGVGQSTYFIDIISQLLLSTV